MATFFRQFGVDADTRIIDVGGTLFNWEILDIRPHVTMVNIDCREWEKDKFRMVNADGTCLPFADNAYDICFSNSVIEHVGDWSACQAFAAEIRRMAPRYWVQTPNRNFFIEPHLAGLFIHWLPARWQPRLIRYCTVWGLVNRPTPAQSADFMKSIRLLDEAEMRTLFPDAEIIHERFGIFFVKSLIAVRR